MLGGAVFTGGVVVEVVGVTLVKCKGVKGRVRGVTLSENRRVIDVVSVGGQRSFTSRTFHSTSITVRFATPSITCNGYLRTFGGKMGIMSNDAK